MGNNNDTINKEILLNWLYTADKELSIELLGKWINAKTKGRYTIIKKEQEADTLNK